MYIQRERERETHTYTYIYIYTYSDVCLLLLFLRFLLLLRGPHAISVLRFNFDKPSTPIRSASHDSD